MKKIRKFFANLFLASDSLALLALDHGNIKTHMILTLKEELSYKDRELNNLKERISVYRMNFLNDHDTRTTFIAEFPANWSGENALKAKRNV